MSVVDLTLDDSNEAIGDEDEGLPLTSNFHHDQIETVPASPAESVDSRDEVYSLADSEVYSNIATIESEVHHEGDEGESDSDVILINPELVPKDYVEDERYLADDPKIIISIEPDGDSDLKTVSNVENEPESTPDESCVDNEPEFITIEDDSDVIECLSDGKETETEDSASDYSVPDLRLYECTFCDFSTGIEEWFHKHMASHAPGTKPYVRVYCPDCTYSTGSLKFLFFHMMKIHCILEPNFYRIGEKRYRCHHCHISKELRIDIEQHVGTHPLELKRRRDLRLKYLCPLSTCRFSSDDLANLPRHIKKSHNIGNPTSYKERCQYGLYYHCFKCSFVSPYKKKINEHSKKHYTDYELMQPYRFLCPSKSCKFSTSKDYRISRHLKSKHSAARAYYRLDSSKFKCFTCGIIKTSSKSMVFHCKKHRKKKR